MKCIKCGVMCEFDYKRDEFWCNICGWIFKMPKDNHILQDYDGEE